MKDKYPGKWVGMTRLVGNRSLVYNRNAMVMFHMLPYYLEYIEYRLKKVVNEFITCTICCYTHSNTIM